MSIQLVPNEILVRYDENGQFQGAHVADLKLLRDEGGTVVHREMQSPRPIKHPLDPAFQDVLSAVLTDALADNATMRQKISELEEAMENHVTSPVIPAEAPAKSGWPLTAIVSVAVTALIALGALFYATNAHAGARVKTAPTVTLLIRPNIDGLCGLATPLNCEANLMAREAQVGRLLGLAEYVPFDFTTIPDLEWAAAGGRPVMFTWQNKVGTNGCALWSDVAGGLYDAQLTAQANYLAAQFPNGIYIRFIPEMDKMHQTCFDGVDPDVDPVTAGAHYAAAQQHVYTFVKAIAPKTVFEFAPSPGAFTDSTGAPSTEWLDFFPGTAYADEICTDPYNTSDTAPVSIVGLPKFENFYSQAVTYGLPLCFAENGAVNNESVYVSPQQKWNASIYLNFKDSYPAMKNMTYFDVTAAASDYHLDGSGLTAFTTMANKTYFTKMGP